MKHKGGRGGLRYKKGTNLAENKISNESPLGKALLGQKKGKTIEVNAPAGVIKYKILSLKK